MELLCIFSTQARDAQGGEKNEANDLEEGIDGRSPYHIVPAAGKPDHEEREDEEGRWSEVGDAPKGVFLSVCQMESIGGGFDPTAILTAVLDAKGGREVVTWFTSFTMS